MCEETLFGHLTGSKGKSLLLWHHILWHSWLSEIGTVVGGIFKSGKTSSLDNGAICG